MTCSGCEAKIPQFQGEPFEGENADGDKTHNIPVIPAVEFVLERDVPAPGDAQITDTISYNPTGFEVSSGGGTCTESGGSCVEVTSCNFELTLVFDVIYVVSADPDAPFDPHTATPPVAAPVTMPWATPTTVTETTPVVKKGSSEGVWTYVFQSRFTTTVEPGCDASEAVTFSFGTNVDIAATGGGGEGGNDWSVDDGESQGLGDVEYEVLLECAACNPLSSSGGGQSTGKNASQNSITNIELT